MALSAWLSGPVHGAGPLLPRATPESQGVSSVALREFLDRADREIQHLHSFMLVRRGQVIAEAWWAPYHPQGRHSLFSLSKSFTSTAVGIAIAEGKLRLDDPVLAAFPGQGPTEPGNNLKAMRLSDLLRMNTGHQTEPPRPPQGSWVEAFLAHPVPFKPGTHFHYNTSATYLTSAMLQRATGETLLDYLQPRLFEPLGIEHPTWELSPEGISTGGYGLSVRTEDIAAFGQLSLQRGEWRGRQLVPAAWIDEATARQTSNGSNPASDWDQGYGYQFWRCRHGAYRGDGAFGQYCVVLPEQQAVVAITSGVRDMQQVLNLLWDHLLPHLGSQPLPANPTNQQALVTRAAELELPHPPATGQPADVWGRTFHFPDNNRQLVSLTLDRPAADAPQQLGSLRLQQGAAEQRWELGQQRWAPGEAAWGRQSRQPCASSAAWSGPGELTIRTCFHETPFVLSLKLRFAGEEVTVDSEWNVGFGPTRDQPLTGRVK
ncbi:MAG: serine hydrolase domain-containing protein [Planctomycetaceae bacterium]